MFIDQYSAQRYPVFAAFGNLYLQTGNPFYKQCAEVFVQPKTTSASCAERAH